jgi:hypothetical protein
MKNLFILLSGIIFGISICILYISYQYKKYTNEITSGDYEEKDPVDIEKEKRKLDILDETKKIKKRVMELHKEMADLHEK